MTNEVYPPEKICLSFDYKKAAKYASYLTIMGFVDFETNLVSNNQEDKIEDAFDRIESCTIIKSAQKLSRLV